jgi:glycine cleavage system H protein
MNTPTELKYAETHEWVRIDGPLVVVGITDLAQNALGDLVYVGDVSVGATLHAGDRAGVVESVKAASDIYAPVAGKVVAFNDELTATPELVNQDPYGAWIFKIEPADLADVDKLQSADDYTKANPAD